MEDITVTLPKRYYASWTLNKARIYSMFPGSLIETTGDLTSDTHIELTQPFLTIDVMNVLETMVTTQKIPEIKASVQSDLVLAGNYLNIDLLVIIGDPKWNLVNLGYNLLDKNDITTHGRWIFDKAVMYDYVPLIDYVLRHGVKPYLVLPSYPDEGALAYASRMGYIATVDRLLKDPRLSPSDYGVIEGAVSMGHTSVVQRLCQDPRMIPNHALFSACRHNQVEIVKLLLKMPKVDPAFDESACFSLSTLSPEIIKELLKDGRCDPSIYGNNLLRLLLQMPDPVLVWSVNSKLIEMLLQDPRVITEGLPSYIIDNVPARMHALLNRYLKFDT